MNDTAECEKCHCKGNSSCGHEPVNKDWLCALMPNGLCPCCNYTEQLESALIDLYEQCRSSQYKTFFKHTYPKKCKEIEALYHKVKENYKRRYGIK